ncbi:MAG: YkgJ family cysteine cluster protein [Dehalococcoidia bacterium]
MTSKRRTDLTPEAASDICMNQCRAGCCRGPLILRLSQAEAATLKQQALQLGIDLKSGFPSNTGGWLKFSDYPGERCPMLDPITFACHIYADRPQRCRDFPERLTPGCALSEYS